MGNPREYYNGRLQEYLIRIGIDKKFGVRATVR